MNGTGILAETTQSSAMFGINDKNLHYFVDLAKDFAVHKGICMRNTSLDFDARVPIPFCLVPSSFPEIWFNLVKDIQPDLNYVLHQVAHSPEFLYSCLKSTIEEDDFTAEIWKIYKTVQDEGLVQPLSLGLLRCDYMLHTNVKSEVIGVKQVENNTFAASFSGLSSKVSDLHMFMLDRLGIKNALLKLPKNSAYYNLAQGMVAAWNHYGREKAAILFVVEDIVCNICDQRALEFAVWEIEKKIHVLRYTLAELRASATLQDQRLIVEGKEIAIVYYRCGYIPAHYSAEDWELRLMMERSRAIKCPSTGYHLAGTKRVQLQLSRPGVLEQFLPKSANGDRIREVFAQQYSLEMNEEGDKAVALAIKSPNEYVLKPEREGGGYNVFGEDIRTLLKSIGSTNARSKFILMEKINPPHITNCIVRSQSVPKISSVVCELGIYGVFLGTKNEVIENYEAGHLIKSKEVGTNEGGIAAGFGSLDSPYLIQ